jgi:aminopeptidase-like protein
VLLGLYNRINKWPKRRFSYRFLLNPETIGSLCFLHEHAQDLKQNLTSGLILTCLGGPSKKLNYKSAKRKDSLINSIMQYDKKNTKLPVEVTAFSPINGSDERQFCAPGFNLPVGQVSRTKYGQYDGYHNSLDTKDFMSIDRLIESIDSIEKVLQLMEIGGNPVNQAPFGEPQLGKRGLYPNMNSKQTRGFSADNQVDGRTQLNRLLTLLNMSDGETSLIEIANHLDCNIDDLSELIQKSEDQNLIKYNTEIKEL